MQYQVDHDYHIHSRLSTCSRDPLQTTERILRYAQENGLKKIVLTDHFWDEKVAGASKWYATQNFDWISQALPLPQSEQVEFFFGAETDMDIALRVGVSDERWDAFSFVIIPTTHLHFTGFTITPEEGMTPEGRAAAWVRRLDGLLSKDLPFYKIGIAHLICNLVCKDPEGYQRIWSLIPDQTLYDLFSGCAQLGAGIELNYGDMYRMLQAPDRLSRLFLIAKEVGCKFYLGSDVHQSYGFDKCKAVLETAVSFLDLKEEHKFSFEK